MKRFALGDIHGEFEKLQQVLELSKFDFENDELIQMGDVVDRGASTFECVDLLLKVKKLIPIKGNHDECFFEGLHTGTYVLGNQGCRETLESYIRNCDPDLLLYHTNQGLQTNFSIEHMPVAHYSFFKNQLPYYVDQDNNCFVHGGFNRHHLIDDQTYNSEGVLLWDRDLFMQARSYGQMKTEKGYPKFKMANNFKEVFIGHTPTTYYHSDVPINAANVWNIDTGSGKGGELTIMNIETKEYFQSTSEK